MAVLALTPGTDQFERVQALAGIAKVLIDIRILCCLLVAIWAAVEPGMGGLTLALIVASGWLLLLLMRWETIGLTLSIHPVWLFADTAVCLVVLAVTAPHSPLVLVLGSGCALTGLCLGSRGAWFLTPLLVLGWWLVVIAKPPATDSAGGVYVPLIVIPVVLAGMVFLGAGIRHVVLGAADTERERQRQQRAAGVAEERARLAREMHDSMVKSLHGVALISDTLPAWIDKDVDKARMHAQKIGEMVRAAADESRAMILVMRRTDAEASVSEQVRGAVERWRKATARGAGCTVTGEPELSVESSYELVAVLNEALENVSRHTPPGTAVQVRLIDAEGWVELQVVDSGPGLPAEVVENDYNRDGHFGLQGMRERAARGGGSLRLSPTDPTGTTVTVRLPARLPDEELEGVTG